jgi:hypothetical protein
MGLDVEDELAGMTAVIQLSAGEIEIARTLRLLVTAEAETAGLGAKHCVDGYQTERRSRTSAEETAARDSEPASRAVALLHRQPPNRALLSGRFWWNELAVGTGQNIDRERIVEFWPVLFPRSHNGSPCKADAGSFGVLRSLAMRR